MRPAKRSLFRNAAILVVALAAILVIGYRAGAFRGALDGSGMWPRFIFAAPDFEALEADRARQREAAPVPDDIPAAVRPVAPVSAADATRTVSFPSQRATASTSVTTDASWPDFRGRQRDGHYAGPIRTEWPSAGLPLLWKQPVGPGYASFVVANGRAFTIEQRRQQEVVAAYDITTGREVWTHGWDAEFVEAMGGDGPRATPTYHEGRVYALGALGELRCLDARTGALVWHRNILSDADAENLPWGMSASPLVVDDSVVVLPGGRQGKSVAAYRKDNGNLLWTALDDQQAYTSPMLVTLAGVRQILIVTASRALGLSPDGRQLLWEFPWATDMGINVAQPLLFGTNRVFLSASYGQGAAVFEVTRDGDRFATEMLWRNTRMKNKFTSSVLHEGYAYGLDEAILACIDLATGDVKWKGGRYGYGQILLAGSHIIVLTEEGELVLVNATPERHEELARVPAIEGKTWNHPVIADGRLLVRNVREMAAFDIRPRS